MDCPVFGFDAQAVVFQKSKVSRQNSGNDLVLAQTADDSFKHLSLQFTVVRLTDD